MKGENKKERKNKSDIKGEDKNQIQKAEKIENKKKLVSKREET